MLKRRRVERLTGDPAVDERAAGLTSGYLSSILEEIALLDDATGCRMTHPFLDARFIEATYGLNPWFPFRDGHDRALAAEAFADRLPTDVSSRRTKAHFSGVSRRVSLGDPAGLRDLMTGPLLRRGWVDEKGLAAVVEGAAQNFQDEWQLTRARALDRWLRVIDA
jgi:hypothetical protein